MDIKKIEIDKLIPAIYNPRKNLKPDDAEYKKIKRSIEQFGYVEPVIWNKRTGFIVGGHQRIKVLKDLGYKEVDCVVIDIDENNEKALNVALNKISGEWDFELLGSLLEELKEEDFDVTLTGFEMDDIEGLLNIGDEPKEVEEDDFNADEASENITEPISKRGDIWLLGKHRLMCGDSTSESDVSVLMDGKKADMVFTDPPYGVAYTGGHDPKYQRKEIKNDRLEGENLTGLFYHALKNAIEVTHDHSAFYVWYASGKSVETYASFANLPLELRAVIQWYKVRSGLGAFMAQYIPNCEPCMYAFKTGCSPQWFGPSDEKTVWELKRDGVNEYHPTQKPIELSARAMTNSSKKGDIILDLFSGSMSMIMGAEQTSRIGYAMELDEKFVDVGVNRYINFKNSSDDVFLIRDGKKMKYSEVVQM